MQDGMLGIGNRRAMEVDIEVSHANYQRYSRQYSCALVDVDYFKIYNDAYGHQAGDEALIKVTNSIKKTLRCSDRVYRYGGEEFLLLLPETNLQEAARAVTRVLDNLNRLQLPHGKSPLSIITVSAGISTSDTHENWAALVQEADRFLYDAKKSGRNQVCWNIDALLSKSDGDINSSARRAS